MKNLKKLFIFSLLMLFSVNVVKADTTCDLVFEAYGSEIKNNTPKSGYWQRIQYGDKYAVVGSENYAVYSFYQKDTNKKYRGYCIDPGKTAGKESSVGAQDYACKRVIMDNTSNDIGRKTADTGLLAIMTSNKNDGIKNLAERIYDMYWVWSNNAHNYEPENKEHRKIANDFYDDKEIQDLINQLRKKLGNTYLIGKKFESNVASKVENTTISLDEAKDLVKIGLRAALNYNPNNDRSLTWGTTPKIKRELTEENNGKITYRQTETYTFNIQNFNTSDSINLTFNPPKNTDDTTISYKFYINNTEVSNLSAINLVKLPKEYNSLTEDKNLLNGKVEFKIEFTGVSTGNKCETIPYDIDVRYSSSNVKAYEIQAAGNMQGQRFNVMAEENESVASAKINASLLFCINNGQVNSQSCSTKLSTVYCNHCEANLNTLNIKEGYDTNSQNCEEITEDELNIPKCIANDGAVDNAGNSYKVNDFDDNPFCGVYCKEDYSIYLPGTQLVNSLRWFTLKATITGTKYCYANGKEGTGINYEEALDMARAAGQNSIKMYNVYADLFGQKEALENADAEDLITRIDGGCGSTLVFDKSRRCTAGGTPDTEKCGECSGGRADDGNYYCRNLKKEDKYEATDLAYTWQQADSNASVATAHGTIELGIEGDYCGDTGRAQLKALIEERLGTLQSENATLIGTSGTVADVSPSPKQGDTRWFREGATGAESKIGPGFMYSAIAALNACSGVDTKVPAFKTLVNGKNEDTEEQILSVEWPEYNFNPQIEFWYADAYMSNAKANMMVYADSQSADEYVIEYCTGEITSDYECTTGWTTKAETKTIGVPACTGGIGSCGSYSLTYSTAKYVRKTMKKERSYVTPSQFYNIYTTGNIVVGDTSNPPKNGVLLENGLPVGAVDGNFYPFTLLVSNLGEHYDTGRLGRIWGDTNSVVADTLKTNNKCYENSALQYESNGFTNGVYSCEYDVDACGNNPNNGNNCKTPSQSEDGEYHCQNGEICDEDEYNKECDNSCKTPTESDDNKYHCKDGEECSEDEYLKQCDPCPDCPVVCDPDGCYKESDKCPDNRCPVYCPTCLYNNGLNVDYRPVSPDNMNPNDRNLGANWDFDDNITSALELKAYKTTTDIESDGAKIYDTNSNNQRITFKVNGSMISEIRRYNEENKDEGYYNNSLECYDFTDTDGVVYKNIYCYSTFIDRIIEKYPDRVLGVDNRMMSEEDRKAKTQTSGYWTTWAEMRDDAKNWNVTTTLSMESYFKNFKNLGVGPSWK